MKKLLFIPIILLALSGIAIGQQVDENTRFLANTITDEVVRDLDGVLISNEIKMVEGTPFIDMAAEFDYISSYSFRSTVNRFVDSYSDVFVIEHWTRVEGADTCGLVFTDNKGTNYVVLVFFVEESSKAKFLVSVVPEEGKRI